jgi:hypothetical protein
MSFDSSWAPAAFSSPEPRTWREIRTRYLRRLLRRRLLGRYATGDYATQSLSGWLSHLGGPAGEGVIVEDPDTGALLPLSDFAPVQREARDLGLL